jgi:hypothetical protein
MSILEKTDVELYKTFLVNVGLEQLYQKKEFHMVTFEKCLFESIDWSCTTNFIRLLPNLTSGPYDRISPHQKLLELKLDLFLA